MKFRKTTTVQAHLKNQKYFDFNISEKQKKDALKRTYLNPIIIQEGTGMILLYGLEGTLQLRYYISYSGFEEGFGKHGIQSEPDSEPKDWVMCECGEVFRSSERISATERFEKHLLTIKKLEGRK